MNFHVGLMLDPLEEVEQLVGRLEEANACHPDLKGRLKFYRQPGQRR
jgi:hypothetical protein